MRPATKETLLENLADIRNEVGLTASALKIEHFAGSGHVRRLAVQVNRLETALTHLIESL